MMKMMEGQLLKAANVSHDEIRSLDPVPYLPAHIHSHQGSLPCTWSRFTSDDLFILFTLPGHTLKILCAIS